ncbi:polymorphic toxin type 24 domain-containing protein [Streptomyces shenzhenensis]|uniref:polymorphic toxin type 24 domain-containing protein n=1 Tax=Streptomyces shenzhenensis TaxID=943815 RepID=UPI0033D778C7
MLAGETPVLVHNSNTGGLSLAGARQVSGRFPKTADPGETLFRQKEDGTATAYARYDQEGAISQRADLDPDSVSHAGIPAPRILDMAKHVNPKTGQVFATGRRCRGLYVPRKSYAAAGRTSRIWMADMKAVLNLCGFAAISLGVSNDSPPTQVTQGAIREWPDGLPRN